ncbi:bifunctional hydroxymethylpyrimidine kinase/phosphomethylpyrimidine kinase [Natronobiforma cellulositropha]|uniref:bifunctional hydroxymethylpyrimidine kinase/phosphomethylpyrimidine kinase n=1 Tax=Natronobiforma cellulositropha TaxID=1679076 RepID=UPI0021D6073A|nr:bifunctional hydroxymethylpyrimidine kinase/phosphomethylpyrimidine kinase [Natronobiforma cellulositropha]
MRQPAPDSRPVALTIAGSDSGGGAGIQADLATMAAHGVFGTSVITAVTAQHTRGVERAFPLPLEEVLAQFDAVTGDFDLGAIKTGMLATGDLVAAVADRVARLETPVVVDPVMVATSGDRLLERDAERAYEELIAESTVVTPNADEAAVLTDITVEDEASARAAGEHLCAMGAETALVKGGHVPGEVVRDVLVTAEETLTLEHPRVDTDATHGSGCALSAAIAARLAAGDDLERAVAEASGFLARAIRYHYAVGQGPGAVNHAVTLRNEAAKATAAAEVGHTLERLSGETDALVAGATPFAETLTDVFVGDSSDPRAEVRPASTGGREAAGELAHLVLAVRERIPAVRFATGVRLTPAVERALEGRVVAIDGCDRAALEAALDSTSGVHRADPDAWPTLLVEHSGKRHAVVVGTEPDAVCDRTPTP